ncbi:SpoIIE family protein phosphatase [bacterium]|nr:SpoIIE family protein phosphatase [bacterium]
MLFLPALVLLFLLWSDRLIEMHDSLPLGFMISFGKLELLAKGIIVGYLLLSLKTITSAWKGITSELSEQRFRYTLAGLILPAAGGSLFMALGRWFLGVPGRMVYTIGVFPTLGIIMACLISYAILRFKLLEIDIILSVGLVYTFLTVFLAGMLELFENALQNFLNLSGNWAVIFSTLVIASVFSPLKDLIVRFVDYIFGKRSFDIALVMRNLLSKMRQGQTPEQVLHQLLKESRDILDFSTAAISLKNGVSITFPEPRHSCPKLPRAWIQLDDLDSIIEAGNESGNFDVELFSSWREQGFRFAFPIFREKEVDGALFLSAKFTKLPYSTEEKNLVTSVCQEVPPILDNLAMLEVLFERDRNKQELEWTRKMYKNIQADTSKQELMGYPIRLYSSLSNAIKGDLINIVDDSQCGFLVVCDAFQQGIQAALTLHIVNSAIRAAKEMHYGKNEPFDPFPAIQKTLSEFSDPPLCSAVTFFDFSGPELRVANAGNPPPVLFSTTGTGSGLTQKGKPLGLEPKSVHPFASVRIPKSDFIFCSTNGLIKAFGDEDGKGLTKFLSENCRGGMEKCHQNIQEALLKIPNRSEFQDDITYVLIEGRS